MTNSGFLGQLLVTFLITFVCVSGLMYDIEYATYGNESTLNYRGYGGKYKYLTFINMVGYSLLRPAL